MRIGTILNQKKHANTRDNSKIVVGKNKKAGNFSFSTVKENRTKEADKQAQSVLDKVKARYQQTNAIKSGFKRKHTD